MMCVSLYTARPVMNDLLLYASLADGVMLKLVAKLVRQLALKQRMSAAVAAAVTCAQKQGAGTAHIACDCTSLH